MAGRTKKSTKKFEKKHLKDTIDRRKEFAKVKQRHQVKAKKKARNAKRDQDAKEVHGGNDPNVAGSSQDVNGQKLVENMNVDEFFQGGFDILEQPQKTAKGKRIAPKTGKRKRTVIQEELPGSSSSEGDGLSQGDTSEDSEEGADFEAHRGDLKALAEKDPEFYKYLQENDKELLEFAGDADLQAIDDLSEDDEQLGSSKKRRLADGSHTGHEIAEDYKVSITMVGKWRKAMKEQSSIRAMRQTVLAFAAAAHVNDDGGKDYKYSISSADVYHELLVTALKQVPDVLGHHLPVKEGAAGKVRVSTDSKKFRTLVPLIKSHTASMHHLLSSLSDASTLKLTLSAIQPMLPYLLQFRKFLKVVVKTVVGIWSESPSDEAVRITAFLILRRLMIIGDSGIREAVLKSTYEGLIRGSRNTTVHTMPGVNLMKNSAAEIWGVDQTVGYTTGFHLVRQLAIHLRSSITKPSKDSYKVVYNWQYVHSLDFWSRVLSANCDGWAEAKAGKASILRPLIYPVVQITIGAMRLIPTAQYLPLRFHLVRSLLRISLSTGTYIPLASSLLEVLNLAEMRKPPKPTTLKALDFSTSIRAPKSYLRTRIYQDGAGEQVAELFSEFFILWAKNIAFPELGLPVTVMLKRWLKEVSSKTSGNKNGKVNQMISLLVQKVEANSKWIEEGRANVKFAPSDRAEVEAFLKDVEWEKMPLGAFVVGQRKMRDERAKLVEQGRKDEERKRAKDKERDEEMADGDDASSGDDAESETSEAEDDE
jgi:nucleolar complex protein 2